GFGETTLPAARRCRPADCRARQAAAGVRVRQFGGRQTLTRAAATQFLKRFSLCVVELSGEPRSDGDVAAESGLCGIARWGRWRRSRRLVSDADRAACSAF